MGEGRPFGPGLGKTEEKGESPISFSFFFASRFLNTFLVLPRVPLSFFSSFFFLTFSRRTPASSIATLCTWAPQHAIRSFDKRMNSLNSSSLKT